MKVDPNHIHFLLKKKKRRLENVNYFLLLVFISLSVSYIIDIYKTEPPKLFKLILFSTDLNFNE